MIEINNVYKGYNGEPVLKGVSLTIEDGQFVSIMGRSGSGKSTLLNVLGGFLPPESGEVLWDGNNVYQMTDDQISTARCNDVGFVFQSFKLISTLCVRDNIYLPASLSHKDKREIDDNVRNFAKLLHIEELFAKYPHQLSGGQCQRVAIVRSLAYSPSMLILDEPTGALDSTTEREVMEIIKKINHDKGTTVIQVTHSHAVAEYASRIITLTDGKIG